MSIKIYILKYTMSRIKNRMYPLAKPFTPKSTYNQVVYYNSKTKQVIVILDTTKNIPKGFLKKVQ